MNFTLGEVVQVIWNDANSHSGWDRLAEYDKLEPEPVMTIGVVLKRNTEMISVAMSQTEHSINQAISIPIKWITSQRVLARLDNQGADMVTSRSRPKTRRRP